MNINRITIIGMGLIGGSVGKALISGGICREVVGVCRRQSSLERAEKEGSFTEGYVNNYPEAIKGADLVMIATPVDTIKKVLKGINESVTESRVLVTDVGSTKKEIVDFAGRFKDRISFVGAHPLAGSEKAGVENSSPDLFKGSLCVLTPDDGTLDTDAAIVRDLWQALGASVRSVTPEEHDGILAFTSHLPHIAAFALAGSMEPGYMPFTSTGFGDTTRVAASDPAIWRDIFMSNRRNVLQSIDGFKEQVDIMRTAIEAGKADDLMKILEDAKKMREGYDEKN